VEKRKKAYLARNWFLKAYLARLWSGKLSWQEVGLQSLLGKNVVWKA
jgi:hypothetical protein